MAALQNLTHARLPGWAPQVCAVLLAGGCVLAFPTGAHAQLVNPFLGFRGPTLSKEDIAAGEAAAGKLLNQDQAQVGKSETWSGPGSEASGRLTVEKAFRRQGLSCRELRSELRYKSSNSSSKTYILNVCRTHTGEWKLL